MYLQYYWKMFVQNYISLKFLGYFLYICFLWVIFYKNRNNPYGPIFAWLILGVFAIFAILYFTGIL
jgi:hypothetical protein